MKNKLLVAALLIPMLIAATIGLTILYHLPLDLDDPAPIQPIAFSHQIHAGQFGIDCRYCHRSVEESPVAGVPDVELCKSCHLYIAADRPEIIKLAGYWEQQQPIPWIRLHRIPEHTYFPHMMHRRADLACEVCHGKVAEMTITRRMVAIKMGWCLNCHRDHGASIDCWTCHR
jgi:hypothetical protein